MSSVQKETTDAHDIEKRADLAAGVKVDYLEDRQSVKDATMKSDIKKEYKTV